MSRVRLVEYLQPRTDRVVCGMDGVVRVRLLGIIIPGEFRRWAEAVDMFVVVVRPRSLKRPNPRP